MSATTERDLWRLADLAEKRGIRLLREHASGEFYASSSSDPSKCYRLTGFSCSCPGFTRHQRCSHHALLLLHLGWLPDVDPEPPAPVAPALPEPTDATCPCCNGSGRDWADANGLQVGITCPVCSGYGEVEQPSDESTERDDVRVASDSANDPTPSPVDHAVLLGCRDCDGTGIRRVHLGGVLANFVSEVCRRCDGTGTVRAEAA